MAGRGPTPKDPAKRRRRNADPTPPTVVAPDGQVRGPELPDTVDWPEQTRQWWNTWRTSPQAQSMTATDWDFLLDTALLHAELWSGVASVAPKLRLRVGKLGATPRIGSGCGCRSPNRAPSRPRPHGRAGTRI
ncbi:hypothetical protein [Actinocrispum wychmicini]|uniref:Uncharacterized protein n=1 Tax=Actinocrispum wychmicini TaxID=1213861 RepID=A0A4R2J5K5_9PSEU|nr:hypothetical protein [Actinocrispum wychmicini]TCO54153.1 hypothetical protein EV192_109133 [Actinocrispum wychmicini]